MAIIQCLSNNLPTSISKFLYLKSTDSTEAPVWWGKLELPVISEYDLKLCWIHSNAEVRWKSEPRRLWVQCRKSPCQNLARFCCRFVVAETFHETSISATAPRILWVGSMNFRDVSSVTIMTIQTWGLFGCLNLWFPWTKDDKSQPLIFQVLGLPHGGWEFNSPLMHIMPVTVKVNPDLWCTKKMMNTFLPPLVYHVNQWINLRNSPAWKVQPFANDAPTNHNLQVSVAGLSLSLLSIDL